MKSKRETCLFPLQKMSFCIIAFEEIVFGEIDNCSSFVKDLSVGIVEQFGKTLTLYFLIEKKNMYVSDHCTNLFLL